jgi:hypothetical protein
MNIGFKILSCGMLCKFIMVFSFVFGIGRISFSKSHNLLTSPEIMLVTADIHLESRPLTARGSVFML